MLSDPGEKTLVAMQFCIQREALLKSLTPIIGVVDKRHSLPVLSNVLLVLKNQQLKLIATDTEMELVSVLDLSAEAHHSEIVDGDITVSGRKLLEICRTLPEQALIKFIVENQKVIIKSGRAKFVLGSLPASEFPNLEDSRSLFETTLLEKDLRYLIDRTQFAMASQDVRYYLNGLMLDISDQKITSVATDGHRLAVCSLPLANDTGNKHQLIIPRKGVSELFRLLNDTDATITVSIAANFVRVKLEQFDFTSKLIDGRFPNYDRVIPKKWDKTIRVDRDRLKNILTRASVLSSEKYRGIKLLLSNNLLRILATNPEHEQVEEELEVEYQGPGLDIGFNVRYLLDVLNIIAPGEVDLCLSDPNASLLFQELSTSHCRYVVMPMRL